MLAAKLVRRVDKASQEYSGQCAPKPCRPGGRGPQAAPGRRRRRPEGPLLRHQSWPLQRGDRPSFRPAGQSFLASPSRLRIHASRIRSARGQRASCAWPRHYQPRRSDNSNSRPAHERRAGRWGAHSPPQDRAIPAPRPGDGRPDSLPHRFRPAQGHHRPPIRDDWDLTSLASAKPERAQRPPSASYSCPPVFRAPRLRPLALKLCLIGAAPRVERSSGAAELAPRCGTGRLRPAPLALQRSDTPRLPRWLCASSGRATSPPHLATALPVASFFAASLS